MRVTATFSIMGESDSMLCHSTVSGGPFRWQLLDVANQLLLEPGNLVELRCDGDRLGWAEIETIDRDAGVIDVKAVVMLP